MKTNQKIQLGLLVTIICLLIIGIFWSNQWMNEEISNLGNIENPITNTLTSLKETLNKKPKDFIFNSINDPLAPTNKKEDKLAQKPRKIVPNKVYDFPAKSVILIQ